MGKQLGDADRPAARLGALGRAVLDARDDGHRPQPRAQRRVGEGPRQADAATSASRTTRTAASCRCSARSCSTSPATLFEEALHDLVEAKGVSVDTELTRRGPRGPGRDVQGDRADGGGRRVPARPARSSSATRSKPCSSRGTASAARDYRRMEKIPDDLGTAVNVQTMVFGNKGDDSGTGVAFTRNPSTGENTPVRRLPHERAGRRRRRRHPHHRAARRDGQRVPRVAHSSCSA